MARYESDFNSLYNRIRHGWDSPRVKLPFWQYDVYPIDLGVEQTFAGDGFLDERSLGKPTFIFACSIRFPQEDYPVLLKRMKRHNARRRHGKRQLRP